MIRELSYEEVWSKIQSMYYRIKRSNSAQLSALFGLNTTANYFSPNLAKTETLSINNQSDQNKLHDSNIRNSLNF